MLSLMHVELIAMYLKPSTWTDKLSYHNRKGSNQTDVNVRFLSHSMVYASGFLLRKYII